MEAVCREYRMQPRRLQEGLAVYKKYAAPSDSVMETAERIFQDAGGCMHGIVASCWLVLRRCL